MYRTLLVGVGLSEGNLIYNFELSGRLVPENNQFGWVLNMRGMMPSVRPWPAIIYLSSYVLYCLCKGERVMGYIKREDARGWKVQPESILSNVSLVRW